MKKNSPKKKKQDKKQIKTETSDKNKILKTLMLILFIYLPFLDILRGTKVKDIEILGIALIELVNFLILGASIILTFLKIDKRKFIKLFIYIALVGVYIVLHYFHIINFDTTIFSKASFDFVVESYYIVRVYILPIIALFVLIENKDIFDLKFYAKVLKIVIAFISFSIIILNITKLSFPSYGGTREFIEYSVLDHFFHSDVEHKMILSKGWFDSANEISAILFGLLPLNILMFFKEKKKSNLVLLIGQIASMIILGTRTSALGSILVAYLAVFIYIVLSIIKFEKFEKKLFISLMIPLLLLTAFYFTSPFYLSRVNELKIQEHLKDTAPDHLKNLNQLENEEEIADIITKNLYWYRVNEVFAEIYPVRQDLDFWIKISEREIYINNNSRQMKIDILSRIKERNNNKKDNLLGMGYTLNFMDVERDYVYQYLLFGGVGVILFLGIYFLTLGKNIIKCIKNLKQSIRFEIAMSFMAPCLIFAIAYLSGHVFGWVSPMMYTAFILGFLTYKVGDIRNES